MLALQAPKNVTTRRLTDNHSRGPVPAAETVSGAAIAVVIIGVSITLPAFLVGTELMAALGLVKGALAIILGGFLTACIGYLTMRVGTDTGLSTYNIILYCFGRAGSRLVNLILATTLFGWFGGDRRTVRPCALPGGERCVRRARAASDLHQSSAVA